MDLISEFIARYRKEYDFYEQACKMASQILESNLQSAGIRAIVTWRAKNPARLEAKVRQRAKDSAYKSVDEISDDIVDLAGVRVALYFPGERSDVGRIIQTLFSMVSDKKEFPNKEKPAPKEKRFSGYWATHYRVRLSEGLLNESQRRYAEASLEIQVASVLMHAWSEVEHDLIYKPMQGRLSEDEYAILDELNGLVLAGEIALERLQRAGEVRVSSDDRAYTSHYDLAASLLEMSREKLAGLDIHDSLVGRVDLLFQLLRALGLNKPDQLSRYVEALHADFEKRPLAEQIIDQVLSEDSTRYTVFENIRALEFPAAAMNQAEILSRSKNEAVGHFMALWADYERMLHRIAKDEDPKDSRFSSSRLIPLVIKNVPDRIEVHQRLRHVRNQIVHGSKTPDTSFINAQITELRDLIEYAKRIFGLMPEPSSYTSPEMAGVVSFDYTNNNGRFVVGTGDMVFETTWSTADNSSIHAYATAGGIDTIALANGAVRIEDIIDARAYDSSSRNRTARTGEILIWKNESGFFLATKIERVSARSHGAERDELVFSYKIASDRGWSFL